MCVERGEWYMCVCEGGGMVHVCVWRGRWCMCVCGEGGDSACVCVEGEMVHVCVCGEGGDGTCYFSVASDHNLAQEELRFHLQSC